MQQKNGFIFLEVLIAITLIGIVCIPLFGIMFQFINLSVALQKSAQANALIKEEAEAVRSFRDGTTWATNGLGSLTTGSAYYMATVTSSGVTSWKPDAGTENGGSFTRKVVVDSVSRDPSTQNIEGVYNASHNDANTRKVTVTVTEAGATYNVVLYLTNWNQ